MSPLLLIALLQAAPAGEAPRAFQVPPRAAEVTGAIGQVTLGPLFAAPYSCTEHPLGQLAYAGDALGTDCLIGGGITGDSGFMRPFRTDGKANADWFGWHQEVLAPFDGTVIGVLPNTVENVPGTMGKPPAGMLQFRNAEGVIVVFGHVTEVTVKPGDAVKAGQPVAKVGNNGMSRAPHIHVGAYREGDATPLQIRWDLRAMAEAQKAAE